MKELPTTTEGIIKSVADETSTWYHYGSGELVNVIEHYQDEIERLLAEREPRPIEDAPKDGTYILMKTDIGIVDAWFNEEEWQWVCYDDKFTLSPEECVTACWFSCPVPGLPEQGGGS